MEYRVKECKKNEQREVPLSQYKILRCHVRYTDKSRIDSVKPGTIVGFKDSEGNFISIKDKKQKEVQEETFDKQ